MNPFLVAGTILKPSPTFRLKPKRILFAFLILLVASVLLAPAPGLSLAPGWQAQDVEFMYIGTNGPLALDAHGNPVITYPQRVLEKLRLAYRTGATWKFVDIDDTPSIVDGYPAIAFNDANHWGISYCIHNPDLLSGSLKYATGVGLSFQVETVEPNWQMDGIDYSSLKFAPTGEPVIAFIAAVHDPSGLQVATQLKLAWKRGDAWDIQVVLDSRDSPPSTPEWPIYGISGPVSLAFDQQGNPVIVYQGFGMKEEFPHDIRTSIDIIRYNGSSPNPWVMETVDSETLPHLSEVSYCWPWLAITPQGYLGVSYLRKDYLGSGSYQDTLKYAVSNGGPWDIQVVDQTGDIGLYQTVLQFDRHDNPIIAYEAVKSAIDPPYEGAGFVRLAQKSGTDWRLETVQGGTNLGPNPELADLGGLAIDNSGSPCLSINQAGTVKYVFRPRSNASTLSLLLLQ
jgi:hypothetical protein